MDRSGVDRDAVTTTRVDLRRDEPDEVRPPRQADLRRDEPDEVRPPRQSEPAEPTPTGRRIPGGRLAVGLAVLVLLFLFVGQVLDLLPKFGNPFGERTVDRSQPVLLQSIQDLSRYEAATGNFQVIIDLEKDARFIPSVIRGERTLFIAAGSVDVAVDFSTIQSGAVTVSEDRTSARIVLPRPLLERANLDSSRSYVYAHQRGIFDRIGSLFSDNPSDQQQLYMLGAEKIQTAAAESGLIARAEDNTRAMLTGLLHSLGFKTVTVEFSDGTG